MGLKWGGPRRRPLSVVLRDAAVRHGERVRVRLASGQAVTGQAIRIDEDAVRVFLPDEAY